MNDHICSAGIASENRPSARLIISASVVERLVADCFLLIQLSGKNEFGPTRAKKPPLVDLQSRRSPAKSAST